jgi:hypothetical protein
MVDDPKKLLNVGTDGHVEYVAAKEEEESEDEDGEEEEEGLCN